MVDRESQMLQRPIKLLAVIEVYGLCADVLLERMHAQLAT